MAGRTIGRRRVKFPQSPIAAPALFDQEIIVDVQNDAPNGSDSALTNERRTQRRGRLLEHDVQRHLEDRKGMELGFDPLVGDITGPQRKMDAIDAKTVAEHHRLTGGGGIV